MALYGQKKLYICNFLIIGHNINSTNLKGIIRKKLLIKKLYLITNAKIAYIAFVY